MELTLAPNPLYDQPQTLHINKVATLIGENGSGKSSILHSIFRKQVAEPSDMLQLICATSGQNENFSSFFEQRLTSLRTRKDISDIDFSSLFFTQKDVRFLTFLAYTFKRNGLVFNFVNKHKAFKDQISVKLRLKISVPDTYIKNVQQDLIAEAKDYEHQSIRKRPFNQRLDAFLEKIETLPDLDALLETGKGLKSTEVEVTNEKFFDIFDGSRIDATKFLIEGSYNEYFFSASEVSLYLFDNIEFSLLSDGEYQFLFVASLIDLFDGTSSLFMFDEVDSHLHYKNVELLWNILSKIKGKVITTTHLVDSIAENDFESLFLVEKGRIKNDHKSQKLLERLKILSKSKVVELEIASKLNNICLIDYYNDWKIFELLAKQKGLDWKPLSAINPIAKSSGYSSVADSFGASKIKWLHELRDMKEYLRVCKAEVYGKDEALHPRKITNVFMICDRDELPEANIHSQGVKVVGVDYPDKFDLGLPCPEKMNCYLLTWKRREIKNYLLSHTVLSHYKVLAAINNPDIAQRNHLQPNNPGDNDDIRRLNAKKVIDPLINTKSIGLDTDKLQAYINLIPPTEISEDITNMYNFIIGKL
ncbi:ATP-binding protein [Rosenbergiella epipactidis]|uniref:ATP-binding protein n=1 Tax=Rosenbergiella epipactidis TaxID=1544694 RepID=UPI001BD92B2F|nr:ATP-binding protein [Rosenbergiella epipactidis]MBT0718617.1 ATP-binding protein [Rosenbergiella epipactidis]